MKAAILVLLLSAAAVFWVLTGSPSTNDPPPPGPKRSTRSQKRSSPSLDPAVRPAPRRAREAPPADHRERAIRLYADGKWNDLNLLVTEWYEVDPAGARDWLAACGDLAPLEAAIAAIAGKIGRAGDPALALQWAGLLHPGPARDRSLEDIYGFAARHHQLTEDQLRAAPLPSDRIERLLSRTADD